MRPDKAVRRIFFFITNRCKNRCKYCFIYDGNPKCLDVSVESFTSTIRNLRHRYDYITLIGGEPLLHPHILELAKISLQEGYKVSISSSGITEVTKELDELFSLPLDDVTISLDSADKNTNDLLRGLGSFDRAMNLINLLKEKHIDFRLTATICKLSAGGVEDLALFAKSLGAKQLDLHVMSLKGRASNMFDIEVEPEVWYNIRKRLDNMSFGDSFNVSYPIMWCSEDELSECDCYCDGQDQNRLSIMADGMTGYFCTIAVGFDEYKINIQSYDGVAPRVYTNKCKGFCLAEKKIATQSGDLKYICRFIKRKTKKI